MATGSREEPAFAWNVYAAVLLLVELLEPDDEEPDDEPEPESEDDEDVEDEEDDEDDFAGELLDEEPRLSLR
jgi:hypothetical protein